MSIHRATPADLSYIESLSKRHATELGFLPREAMLAYLTRDRVTLAKENGDPCGYFLTSGLGQRQARVFQACVQYDARGLKHGILLLSSLITQAAQAGTSIITLHCRDGLESNGFWSACGFESGSLLLGGSARRKIVHEWTLRIGDALANPALPYARDFLAHLGARAQAGTGATPSPLEPAAC